MLITGAQHKAKCKDDQGYCCFSHDDKFNSHRDKYACKSLFYQDPLQVFLRNYIIFVSIGVKLTEPAGSESLLLTHALRVSRM